MASTCICKYFNTIKAHMNAGRVRREHLLACLSSKCCVIGCDDSITKGNGFLSRNVHNDLWEHKVFRLLCLEKVQNNVSGVNLSLFSCRKSCSHTLKKLLPSTVLLDTLYSKLRYRIASGVCGPYESQSAIITNSDPAVTHMR